MAFVKLDEGILSSTLWADRDARDVFITALLLAEPWEFSTPTPTLEVRTLEAADWTLPPGWYGFARAAGPGLVRTAGIEERDAGMAALERLAAPDLESRSHEHGGRRLVRVDGGYVVLNFMKYRDHDHGSTERSRKLRSRKRAHLVTRLIERDGAVCGACSEPLEPVGATVGKRVPPSKGGGSELGNLILLHPGCAKSRAGTLGAEQTQRQAQRHPSGRVPAEQHMQQEQRPAGHIADSRGQRAESREDVEEEVAAASALEQRQQQEQQPQRDTSQTSPPAPDADHERKARLAATAILDRFPEAYRGDVETVLTVHRNPFALSRELAAILDGMHGPRIEARWLGQALRDILLAGGDVTGPRLRSYARRAMEKPSDRPLEIESADEDEWDRAAKEVEAKRAKRAHLEKEGAE